MPTPTSTPDEPLLEGRYRLLYPLGEGGSATVFEALDEKLGTRVAIKLLSEHDPAQREAWRARFDAEVLLTARQQHPNIVRVMDTGTSAHGAPFLVMELLGGHTLAHELWQHGPLARERALRLFRRLLHALGSLHNAGVVHRDLKPSNLFITAPRSEAEDIKLLDLGIAFDFTASGARHTKQDERVGTPAYMAPEYEVYDMISPAGDVYQAALIALEMLTGSDATAAGAESIPTRLEALRRDDEGLATILSCALADDPDERYPVASALLDAITALDPPAPNAQKPAVPAPPTSTPPHQTPYGWRLGVAAILLILVGALLMSRASLPQASTTTPTSPPTRLTPPQQPLIDSSAPAKPTPLPKAPQAPTQASAPHTQDAAPAADQRPLIQPKRQLKTQPKVDDQAKDPLKEQLKQELLWMEHGEH